jgi:hypothetical protein
MSDEQDDLIGRPLSLERCLQKGCSGQIEVSVDDVNGPVKCPVCGHEYTVKVNVWLEP